MRRLLRRSTFALGLSSFVLTPWLWPAVLASPKAPSPLEQVQMRRPVALVLAEQDRRLYVANRRSGSISIVDLDRGHVLEEVQVGQKLSDLVVTPSGRFLLATDEQANRLIVLRCEASAVEVVAEVPVAASPVKVVTAKDGPACFVASLWPRVISKIDLSPLQPDNSRSNREPRVRETLPLPFAPRELLLVREDSILLAADSFGGRLGVVETARCKLVSVKNLPAHNIRGFTANGEGSQLYVSHQLLNSLAETTHNDVHWGVLLTNNLRRLDLKSVLSPKTAILAGSQMHFLGDPGNATGDPAGVAVTDRGTVVVALAGVNQVAIGERLAASFHRVPVGRRPTSVVLGSESRRAYVANTFSDSISVIDLESVKVQAEISLGPQPEPTLVDQGEMLFHDARLSLDGWYSCHSCHTDGHTNGLLADNLGDGTFGSAKRVLSLLGTGETGPWAWNGKKPALADQIRISIRSTMQGPTPDEQQVRALEEFLRSLQPPPPRGNFLARKDPEAVARGEAVFRRQRCTGCHREPNYTAGGTYAVGLDDGQGTSRFNPPSLRGVSQAGPYFHDSRAKGLVEVFQDHEHGLKQPLPEAGLRDLLAFLESL